MLFISTVSKLDIMQHRFGPPFNIFSIASILNTSLIVANLCTHKQLLFNYIIINKEVTVDSHMTILSLSDRGSIWVISWLFCMRTPGVIVTANCMSCWISLELVCWCSVVAAYNIEQECAVHSGFIPQSLFNNIRSRAPYTCESETKVNCIVITF